MDSDPIPRLDRRWRQGFAGTLLETHFQRWRALEPALAPLGNVAAALRALRDGGSRDRDAVLLALLKRARVDPLAGQLVLEAILPGLKKIAGRLISDASQLENVSATLLFSAWGRFEAIRSTNGHITSPPTCFSTRCAAR